MTVIGTNYTWTTWTASCGTSAVCSDVWVTWATNTTTSYTCSTSGPVSDYTAEIWVDWTQSYVETEEARQARENRLAEAAARYEAERIERQARAEEERKQREAASQRALLLLLSILNAEQRKEYEERKQFHVRSKSGKRYQISKGRSQNIHEVDEQGLRLVNFCAHPKDYDLPDEDHMVAQKLFLENNEEAFLKVANRSQPRRMAGVAA